MTWMHGWCHRPAARKVLTLAMALALPSKTSQSVWGVLRPCGGLVWGLVWAPFAQGGIFPDSRCGKDFFGVLSSAPVLASFPLPKPGPFPPAANLRQLPPNRGLYIPLCVCHVACMHSPVRADLSAADTTMTLDDGLTLSLREFLGFSDSPPPTAHSSPTHTASCFPSHASPPLLAIHVAAEGILCALPRGSDRGVLLIGCLVVLHGSSRPGG
jgi:hypothetical protein